MFIFPIETNLMLLYMYSCFFFAFVFLGGYLMGLHVIKAIIINKKNLDI